MNYWHARKGFTPCHQAFCGKCYSLVGKTKFFIKILTCTSPENENEDEDTMRLQEAWADKHRDPLAFLQARDGDHLHIPFEYDLCVFRKLKGVNPHLENPEHSLLLDCIKRMMLGAF